MGNASLKTMRLLSGELTERIGAVGLTELAKAARWVPFWNRRLALNRRSSESIARPLTGAIGCQWRLGFILKVSVSPSGENSQDSAWLPMTSPSEGLPR